MRRISLLKSALSFCICIGFIFLATIQMSEAARVLIGVSTYYGPNVVYIPGHWYYGYWVPGQYVEYAGPPPASGYIWYGGGFDGGHRWHHGHWEHHHHH